MTFSHSKKQFDNLIKKKSNFIFYKKILKLNYDPIPSFINLVEKNKYSFLYESVEKGREKGRYSICGYDSLRTIQLTNDTLTLENNKVIKKIKYRGSPLKKIDSIIKNLKFIKSKRLPPMSGAFFGYIAYENINKVEKISSKRKKDDLKTPDIIMFIPNNLLIYDNFSASLFIIKHYLSSAKTKNFHKQILDINEIENNIKKVKGYRDINFNKKKKITVKSNMAKTTFKTNIKKAKQYIKNGDIFQVVPSQRFETNFNQKSSFLYEVLRKTNPSPFMYYFNLPKFEIVGSSPEILVRLRSNEITIRPIAGTRPRGKNKIEDKKFESELMNDKKEIAEHLMLLDLGRNDVGKVSKKSSVKVTSKFKIERYSHVMHIVSNVTGKLKNNTSSISALMAGFPAGTVSGAPKIRAMQIIDELETTKRGIYSGGIGYISSNGDMDTCIVLRTGIITKNKLYVQAGGGVVFDSDSEKEFNETVNKAKAVLNAAEIVMGNVQ